MQQTTMQSCNRSHAHYRHCAGIQCNQYGVGCGTTTSYRLWLFNQPLFLPRMSRSPQVIHICRTALFVKTILRDENVDRIRHLSVGWCGVVWCGIVWCAEVWCCVVWCNVVLCGVLKVSGYAIVAAYIQPCDR